MAGTNKRWRRVVGGLNQLARDFNPANFPDEDADKWKGFASVVQCNDTNSYS